MFDHEGFQGSHEPPRPTLFQRLKSFVSSHFTSKADDRSDPAGIFEPKVSYNDHEIQEARSIISALFTIMGAGAAYLMSHEVSDLADLRYLDLSLITLSSASLAAILNYWDAIAIVIALGAILLSALGIVTFNCKLERLKRHTKIAEDQYKLVVAQERATAQAEAQARIDKDKAETKTQEALAALLKSLNNEAVPSFTDAAQSISGAAQAFGDYYKIKTEQLKNASIKAQTETEEASRGQASSTKTY